MGPKFSLFIVSALLVMGASNWRRSRIRRAVRDLPTRAVRQLGPEPEYAPPAEPGDDLAAFAALHKRTRTIMHVVWGLAGLWLIYVLFLLAGGTAQ